MERKARIDAIQARWSTPPPSRAQVLAALAEVGAVDAGSTAELKARELASLARGLCAEKRREHEVQIRHLEETLAMADQVPARTARKKELDGRLEREKPELADLVNQEKGFAAVAEKRTSEAKEAEADLLRLKERSQALRELRELRRSVHDLAESAKGVGEETDSTEQRLRSLNEQRRTSGEAIERLTALLARLEQTIDATEVRQTRLRKLQASCEDYAETQKRKGDLNAQIIRLNEQASATNESLRRLQIDKAAVEKARDEFFRAHGRAKVTTEETSELIGRFKSYVGDAVCPLCGHQHSSKDELLEAIDARLQALPGSQEERARNLQKVELERQRLNKEISDLQGAKGVLARDLEVALREREEATAVVGHLDAEAQANGVIMLPESLDSQLQAIAACDRSRFLRVFPSILLALGAGREDPPSISVVFDRAA